ncbi:MAG TPA: imelysin family protein [Myxococcota bacterium]
MNRPAIKRPFVAGLFAAALGASTTMVACPADGDPPPEGDPALESDRQRLLTDWEGTLLLPTHAEFVTTSQALIDASTAFCAAPDDAALFAATQAAWSATHSAFKHIEVFRFGPIVAYPERYGPTVDFWPAREARIEAVLADDEPITASRLRTEGAVARGLPVVEVLLWQRGDAGDNQALFTAADGARRCSYLVAASEDIHALASGLDEQWRLDGGAYVRHLTAPSSESEFPTVEAAFSELVNRMGFTVENVRRDKLGRTSAENIESGYSGRSIEAMRENLTTVMRLFYGGDASARTTAAEATATAPLGLIDHPRLVERPDLIAAFETAQHEAIDALEAVDAPFAVAVTDDRDGIAAADAALATLQRVIQADLLNVLSLTLAFNDNDGD